MTYNSHDLTPLQEGDLSDLSFADDPATSIEKLASLFNGQNDESDPSAILFNEELSVLKCGLVVLKKELPLFRNPTPELLADIEDVRMIAKHFDGTEWVGAASSRFAPVLFGCPSSNDSIWFSKTIWFTPSPRLPAKNNGGIV